MSNQQTISAAVGYIPVIGWIYAILAQRKDEYVWFHLKQSLGLFAGMLGALLVWLVVYWLLAWIPYGGIFGTALFALVLALWIVGLISWVVGILNALRGKMNTLPFFGSIANRLPL
jgi:uncharacterized membrane protein